MELYGIGVGPGDPELLTIKAVKALQSCPHIFTASSTKNEYSLAFKVAREYIPSSTPVEALSFPMTKDPEKLKHAWEKNAQRVVEVLKSKGKAGFITLGDPCLFSTFGYLAREVKKIAPQTKIFFVPGITAAQAAASSLNLVLAEGEKGFAIISGLNTTLLKDLINHPDVSIAVYKVYKNKEEIISVLKDDERGSQAIAVHKCGFPEERVFRSLKELDSFSPSYFTLLLVGGSPVEVNTKEEEQK